MDGDVGSEEGRGMKGAIARVATAIGVEPAGVLVCLLLTGSATTVAGQDAPPPLEALGEVVDSLPTMWTRSPGSADDLFLHTPTRVDIAGPDRPTTDPAWAAEWLREQANKALIAGTCPPTTQWLCGPDETALNVRMRWRVVENGESLEVFVGFASRKGGPPRGQGGFGVDFRVTFRRDGNTWRYEEAVLTGIT
jgi:hypothetical protein